MKRQMVNVVACMAFVSLAVARPAGGEAWPQFRGPAGAGVSPGTQPLPTDVGPNKAVRWKVAVSPGVSSPVVAGERVFLTGVKEGKTLVTFALSAKDGSLLWEREAPIRKLETTDKKPRGRLATATVTTDGEHVVSFFGSSGLLCYTVDGERRWYRPMGPFENRRGATSSPIIHDGKVVIVQDHEVGSFVEVFDVVTGKTVWRTERSLFNRSYGTPVVHKDASGREQVVLVGSGLVTSYDLRTGKLLWYVQGTSAVANPMAVTAGGRLFVASANPGPKRSYQPSFSELVAQRDADKDGALSADELPSGLFAALFPTYDENKDGRLGEPEYKAIQKLMGTCRNGLIALDVKGESLNRTPRSIAWSLTRSTPRTATPIHHDGHLYMVKDGGVFTTVNAATGEVVKTDRISAKGKFFSSPVMGDGKVYVADDRGKLLVISAKSQWEVVSEADFDEPIYPTPAISDGRLYVRTETTLYCFGVDD